MSREKRRPQKRVDDYWERQEVGKPTKSPVETYWKGYLAREKKEEPTEGDSRAEGYWREYLRKEKKRKLRERKVDPESLFADERVD